MVEYLGFILLGKDQDTFIKRVLICIGQYKVFVGFRYRLFCLYFYCFL